GAVTIRAFGKSHAHLAHLMETVDANHRAFLPLWAANRWLAFRVETVGALVAFGTGTSIAFAASAAGRRWGIVGRIDPGWAGLVLNYAGMFTDVLTWLVRNSAQMEMTMTSVERLQEYTRLEQERPAIVEGYRVPESWPSQGAISLQDLGIAYNSNTQLALDLPNSVSIPSGQSVAIVGRTGSGKSTLGMSFVRFVEYKRGTIVIDGVDISMIGLRDLRENVVVIPQDPFLFRGTIRANLDPTGEKYTMHELSTALEFVTNTPVPAGSFELSLASTLLSLDTDVSDSGSNLSAGQKQMLSLARGVLHKNRLSRVGDGGGLVILDEATASLDSMSDGMMQRAIRRMVAGESGKTWTSITIAHRLKSVVDLDRVLVLSEGRVVEDGNPKRLLEEGKGAFAELWRHTM
ncbi:hypothetical protein HDU98_006746, partial [Podochytrium sp. JEL0797]